MTSLAKNLLFFLPKVFSPGPLTHGDVAVWLRMSRAVSRGSLTIPSQSHFQKTFLLIYFFKMGVCKTCDFLTLLYHTLATSLHLEGLDVAKFSFERLGERLRAAFSYYIHRRL